MRGEPHVIGSPDWFNHVSECWRLLNCAHSRATPDEGVRGYILRTLQARSVSFLTVSLSIKSGFTR
jgi:hypothetical protein